MFTEGTPKPKDAGRKKGTPNKTTQKARDLITDAINNQSKNFQPVMQKLKDEAPHEWAKIMVQLMKFVLPTKVDVTTDGETLNKPQAAITLSNGTTIDLS